MKTSQNTVVMAYFLAAHQSHQAMQALTPENKSAIRSLRRLITGALRKKLKALGLKPKKISFRLQASPDEVSASCAHAHKHRTFFVVPTRHIPGRKVMAPFQGIAKYSASSNCTGIGVQVNVSAFGGALPNRRQSFVRQIVDWIIAWYKQEYESQSVNPVPEGHVLRSATPWSMAYTVPVRTTGGGQGRRARWRDRRVFRSASFA